MGQKRFCRLGWFFFGPICQVKIIGYNTNLRNLFFLSLKRLTAVLNLTRERAQLIKNGFIEGVGATRLNFYFPSFFSSSFVSFFINHLPFLLLLIVVKCKQHLSLRMWACLVAQTVKNSPAMQVTQVWSLGWKDPLEKGMATHFSNLAWRISWTEKPGGLQSMGLQRVGLNSD